MTRLRLDGEYISGRRGVDEVVVSMGGASLKGAGLILVLMFFLLPVAPAISGAAPERVYSMGVVPQFEIRRIHEIWSPIMDYVREKSGLRLELVPSSTIPDFERAFGQGAL